VNGIRVHRLPLYPSHDRSSLGRILNYVSFFISAAVFCTFSARRFDVIYAYPPLPAWLAAALSGLIARRPVVVDIQDLWPDSVVKSGMAGTGYIGGALTRLCNFIYRRATLIVAQSKGIANKLRERGVPDGKIRLIYNWADEQAAAASGACDLTPYHFADRFNIVYGGNLGRVQGLETLVRAAHLAGRDCPRLQLLLIGGGIEADRLRVLVDELGADNVRIAPGVPREQIGDVFAAADVLALHLWDDPLFEITIPSKLQFYMAMGKPILIGVKGEAGQFVTEAGAGIAVPPQNAEAMAQAMMQLAKMPATTLAEMGNRARDAYWKQFAFAHAIEATEDALRSAVTLWGEKRGKADVYRAV
jgi:glycosyltransferase involved in cell wall biosynthesis